MPQGAEPENAPMLPAPARTARDPERRRVLGFACAFAAMLAGGAGSLLLSPLGFDAAFAKNGDDDGGDDDSGGGSGDDDSEDDSGGDDNSGSGGGSDDDSGGSDSGGGGGGHGGSDGGGGGGGGGGDDSGGDDGGDGGGDDDGGNSGTGSGRNGAGSDGGTGGSGDGGNRSGGDVLQLRFGDGHVEQVRNGLYERTDRQGRVVERRQATRRDVSRLDAFRAEGAARQGGVESLVLLRPSQGAGQAIDASGWSEVVSKGIYQLTDPNGNVVTRRNATNADLARLQAMAGR